MHWTITPHVTYFGNHHSAANIKHGQNHEYFVSQAAKCVHSAIFWSTYYYFLQNAQFREISQITSDKSDHLLDSETRFVEVQLHSNI